MILSAEGRLLTHPDADHRADEPRGIAQQPRRIDERQLALRRERELLTHEDFLERTHVGFADGRTVEVDRNLRDRERRAHLASSGQKRNPKHAARKDPQGIVDVVEDGNEPPPARIAQVSMRDLVEPLSAGVGSLQCRLRPASDELMCPDGGGRSTGERRRR